jgi:hypothetical protein
MNLLRRTGRALPHLVAAGGLLMVAACGTETADPGADASDSLTTGTSPTPTVFTGSPLTTAGLQTGPAPAIAYAVNGQLVLPDGGGFALPKESFDFARLGDLTVVMRSGPSDSQPVTVLDADGKAVRHDNAVGGGLAVNADGDVIAWMGFDNHPRVLDRGGSRIIDMPDVTGGRRVVDVAGRVDCQEGGEGEEGGCTLLVNTDEGEHQSWVSTSHGFSDWTGPIIGGVAFLHPADGGGILGYTKITDDSSCSGRWDWHPTLVWQTCGWRFLSTPSQGDTILAGSAYADGLGDGRLGFLDVDGNVGHSWGSGPGTIVGTPQWEDDEHVLAVIFEGDQWSVVRFGIDGSTEYAVPPQAGTDTDSPYLLQTT